ncbi:MAG: hypothetical protein ACQES8_10220 [Thermodesulfobacteriota bacterium]
MWKHLILLCAMLGTAKFYGVDISTYYQDLADSTKDFPILSYTVLSALILIIFTFFLKNSSLILGIIRLIIRLIQEISLFAVSLISFGSIYWAIWEDGNPWQDFQSILPIPAIFLLTVVICTNIIDFNQPIIKIFIPYIALAAISFLVVNLAPI